MSYNISSIPLFDRQAKRLSKKYPSLKGKGKSSGARIIIYVRISRNIVFLASIFDKSEKSTITDKELGEIFKLIP